MKRNSSLKVSPASTGSKKTNWRSYTISARYDFDLCRVVIRTRVDRQNPEVPTITGIYAGANWHERETHEFFGIKFAGHPHLVPLLLPEDADFHPLLKDFKA